MSLLTKIRMFFGKAELISALETTIELLSKSEDSVWSNLTVSEIKEILEREIRKIKNNQDFDKLELAVLYAVTSNVQETAMWNGWHNEYLKIADTIDKFTNR